MTISFLGSARTVTGSCTLIETENKKILVDCGLYQGSEELEARNRQNFEFNPKTIDFVLLTHAHLDHSGMLPKLVREGFTGPILATYPTVELCEIMLLDSAKVQIENLRRDLGKNRRRFEKKLDQNLKGYLAEKKILYSAGDARRTMNKFKGVVYDRTVDLGDDVSMTFRDAGHILGSAFVELNVSGKVILFSGDLGHKGQYLMNDVATVKEADYVVVESTYGDRYHEEKALTEATFFKVIEETVARGGNVIIPSFAVERTQELLYAIHNKAAEGKFDFPVYLDSPMALRATEVFGRSLKYYNSETKGFVSEGNELFEFNGLYLISDVKESFSLRRKKGAVIIAGSGMCTGGRVLTHLKNNLSDPNTTVMFVGFQAEGTLGREILQGEEMVVIDSKKVKVNAKIESLGGFSAHADKGDLISWIQAIDKNRLKRVFLIHGEYSQQGALSNDLKKNYNYDVYIPLWKEKIEIE